jgi:uncharacterized membrane protein YedE/YeeE
MRRGLVAFASGLLFGGGLSLAGMTRPSKVIGFLDFAGDWDPSLAMVMLGAIGVHLLIMRWARRARGPVLARRFHIPVHREVDWSLLVGAAVFGIGWGLAGYCPGPAVTSLGSPAPSTVLFLVSMLAGMLFFAVIPGSRAKTSDPPRTARSSSDAPRPIL